MPPKPRSKSEYKPLTPSDYQLYNQMVLGFHALEQAATNHFLRGISDRKKLAALVEKQIVRTLKALQADMCECPIGTCQQAVKNGFVCRPCGGFPWPEFETLIRETGEYIEEVGCAEFSKQLNELRNVLPTRPPGR